MIAITRQPRRTTSAQEQDNEQFLKLVPAITRYARFALRDLQPQEREEALSEVLAQAFCAFRRLVELGKQDLAYASPLARFAVSRLRAGRCVGANIKSRDVFAVANQCRRACLSNWLDMLADDSLTPVPDQVAFRLDFSAWLRVLNRRDRKLAEFLAVSNTTREAAEQFGVSRGRISQLRGELQASWTAFQGEAN
jgi:hypothetical protein